MKTKLIALVFGANCKCVLRTWKALIFFASGFQILPINAALLEDQLTLTAAIQRSLEQHPSLKVFPLRDAALQGRQDIAKLKPAYELDVELENFMGSGDFKGLDEAELSVSLSSVIEMGGKREARGGLYASSRSVLKAQKEVESLELLGEVTRRFIDVLAAQERVALATEATELATTTLAAVTARSKAGSTPAAEVKRASAARAQSHLTLLSEQQQLAFLKVALAVLWGDTTPQNFAASGDLFLFGNDAEFKPLKDKMQSNPNIQVFSAQERLKDSEVRLAKTESRSDIRWSVGVRRFQELDETALTAGISIPLFSSKRNTGAVSSVLMSRNEIRFQKDVALLQMHTQLFRAFGNRQNAIVSANTLRQEIIPSLKDALLETQKAYERGRYSYLDYVAAQRELLNARRMVVDAAAAALTYGSEIEQLTAQSLAAAQFSDQSNFKD